MATLTPPPPAPVKPAKPRRQRPVPPDDADYGVPSGPTGGTTYPAEEETPFVPPAKRRSYWPFLVDLGLVMALFGLVIGNAAEQIVGQLLMVAGVFLFIVALFGWIREARAEYSKLRD